MKNMPIFNIKSTKPQAARSGFTIVELLVVIVVIGLLSTIVFVSFRGITARANETVVISDLANAKKQLALYHAEHGQYPTAMVNNCPTEPIADNTYCIKPSSGTAFTYTPAGGTSYGLKADKGTLAYQVSPTSSPTVASALTCPTGFIIVPGSSTYGTNDFCVMKYEAKNAGSNVPTSTPTGTPWVSISQTDAITYSPNVAGCTGCHLITEAEWMTLAKNVLSVASNWSGGSVGSGYIFSGHNDNSPASALVADASDANGYANTGNTSGDATTANGVVGNAQKRTLTLTNGEVIWDMAGNVLEWTAGQTTGGQPGIASGGYAWREYPALTSAGSLAVNATAAGTGLGGAGSWTSANGIGQIYSSTKEAALHGFLRGGTWDDGVGAGVLFLYLGLVPSGTDTYVGFRVSR